MKKQITAFLLTCALCAGTAAGARSAENDLDGHWAADSFERLEKMGVIKGYEDGYYRPDGKITRAEFFAALNRVCGASENRGSEFSDVDGGAWYKNAVDCAYTAGYASGDGDGAFRPEENITRAEAAAAVYKAFGGDPAGELSFTDSENIAEWAADAVKALSGKGCISGYKDGTFRPEESITRAEAFAVLDRLAGILYSVPGSVSDECFEKTLVVGASDIVFRNTEFKEDVYLPAGIYGGEIRFVNCSFGGDVIFAGRGGAAAVFENSVCPKAVVSSAEHTSIIASGGAEIAELIVRSECDVMEMSAEKGFEKADIYAYTMLSGSFDRVSVYGGGVKLANGKIKELTVSAPSRPQIDILGKTDFFTAETACVLNGKSIAAGYKTANAGEEANKDVYYSYTLSRLYADDFETEPVIGGARTEIQTDREYSLSEIGVSAGALSPAFSPDITEYTLVVPNSEGSVVIAPQAAEYAECRAEGIEISGGLRVSIDADSSKTVNIDVYGGYVKKKTYTVTVTGYGPSDTGIAQISADLPYTCTAGGEFSYELAVTEAVYTGNSVPVTMTVKTVNEKSGVLINGIEGNTYTVDLLEKRTAELNVRIISEDGQSVCDYTVTVTRPVIPEIDNPDSDAVNGMINSPESVTAEALAKAKITGIKEENIEKYGSYLAQIAYRAENKDVYEKQEVIQTAVDVVNEWSGKRLRVEAEDFWSGTINEFADDASKKYCIGIESFGIQLNAEGGEYAVPEGIYNMTVRWGSKFESNADGNPVLVNGVTVYNGTLPKTWLNSAVTSKTLKTNQLGDTVISGIKLGDVQNTVTFTEKKRNLVLDYFELEMVFD